jgi:hypothetical protein
MQTVAGMPLSFFDWLMTRKNKLVKENEKNSRLRSHKIKEVIIYLR